MEIKELNKAIDAFGARNAKIESDLQELGLATLAHLEAHNDTMPMNRLINVLRRGQHNPFMQWVLAFGKVAKNLDKVTAAAQPVVYAKDRVNDIEAATAKPWFEFADDKETAVAKAFDFQGATMALLKKAAQNGTSHDKLLAIAAVAGIKPEKVPATVVTTKVVPADVPDAVM